MILRQRATASHGKLGCADSRPSNAARPRLALWLLFLLMLPVLLPLRAQNGQLPRGSFPQPIGQPVGGGISDIPAGEQQSEEQLRFMNKERHKSMVSDTNKLLRLAGELDAELKATPGDSLTPGQLRKLGEIEKLARNVREKMSYSVRTTPLFREPPPMPNMR